MARARTASGETQPLAQEWNPSGYYWNVVHSVAVNLGSPVSAEPVPAPALEPPAGYRSACLICHDEAMMSGQRLNPAQWEREVDKMIRWGAPVKPEHREGIVRYLVTRFGPRKL
jgi:hypothetical protein